MFLFSSLKNFSCCKGASNLVTKNHQFYLIHQHQSCKYRFFSYLKIGSKRTLNFVNTSSYSIPTLQYPPRSFPRQTSTRNMTDIKINECDSLVAKTSATKPPTILVYTSDNEEFYHQIYLSLNKILPESTYSIFHISTKSLLNDAWYDENIACIILSCCKDLTDQLLSKLELCHRRKIKVISSRPIQESNSNVMAYDMPPENFITECKKSSLLSDALKTLGFDVNGSHTIPDLTYGYFICSPDDLTWQMEGLSFGSSIGNSPTLLFEPIAKFPDDAFPTSSDLPIKVCRRKNGFPDGVSFNAEQYYEVLNTKCLGRALLFVPVCETTINISKSLRAAMPSVDGIIVVAECQINGIGRSGNQWLSPKGCAMLTFNYNIPLSSHLGSNATFIQLILAVSICDAVKSLLNLPEFPISIKWPNDIYFERKYKLGGIMITSSITGTILQCTIGAGLNVANSKPTICINDLLPFDCDRKLSVEEVIAETMNKFEYYINMFENQGKQAFLRRYYDLWLHTGEEVEIIQHSSDNKKEMVTIKGLDEYGYLQVQSKINDKVFSVHDDGNTFDMMKGLIRPKMR